MIKETQSGNTAKAIDHYEKFLFLWKDAEPGIAEAGEGRPVWKLRVEGGIRAEELAGAAA